MNTQQVADGFAALLRQGKFLEAVDKFYGAHIVSVEAMELGELGHVQRGLEAVRGKNVWWFGANEVHKADIEGPYVGHGRFALRFHLDYTNKESGQRTVFAEVAIYTVEEGKVVREEFLYGPMG